MGRAGMSAGSRRGRERGRERGIERRREKGRKNRGRRSKVAGVCAGGQWTRPHPRQGGSRCGSGRGSRFRRGSGFESGPKKREREREKKKSKGGEKGGEPLSLLRLFHTQSVVPAPTSTMIRLSALFDTVTSPPCDGQLPSSRKIAGEEAGGGRIVSSDFLRVPFASLSAAASAPNMNWTNSLSLT